MKQSLLILVVLSMLLILSISVVGQTKWDVNWLELELELEQERAELHKAQQALAVLKWRMEMDDIYISRLLTRVLGQMKGELQVIGLEGILENRIEFHQKRVELNLKDANSPTFEELLIFLSQDGTDSITLMLGSGPGDVERFVCWHFAGLLAFQARQVGIKMDVVTIWFSDEIGIAHAINRVETTDKGFVYIEPQNDEVILSNTLKPRKGGGYIWEGNTHAWFAQWRPVTTPHD